MCEALVTLFTGTAQRGGEKVSRGWIWRGVERRG